MQLKFTKMHGAGNDFVMIDGVSQAVNLTSKICRHLADRRFGVGADQILLVEASDTAGVDFRYRIFNADGNEVEQCGNGARCFVRFVRNKGLTDKTKIRVQTQCGIIEPAEQSDGRVRVDMGPPRFTPADIGFDTTGLTPKADGGGELWPLPLGEIAEQTRWVAVASMGNPHAVQIVGDTENAPVHTEGPLTEKHQRFAAGVNAGFMQVVDTHQLKLRVWERGVGETLACGTGACAAGALAIRHGLVQSPVEIQALGGKLTIEWDIGAKGDKGENGGSVFMTGDANTVFEGEIEIPAA
ncbi:MAG: diaminopimelate epimerase [Burkholderiaceae bacterium]